MHVIDDRRLSFNMDKGADPLADTTNAKVTTLANWKRLANVPDNVNIMGLVQAVHWCDYIVSLDDKHIIYLYHLKWGIWSSMNSMNLCTPANGCPLGVFGKDLIMVPSGGGGIYTFSMDTGHWIPHESLNTSFGSGSGVTINNVILVMTSDRKSLFVLYQQTVYDQNKLYLRQYCSSSWSKAEQLNSNMFLGTNQVSYAIVQEDLYVCTGTDKVYIVHTQLKEGVRVKVTDIRLPQSLSMSTICGVNNTVFSFGGRDRDNQPSSDINRYNPTTKKWEPAGYMRSCRFSVIISPFIRDNKDDVEIFVVGGYLGGTMTHNTLLTCRIAESCEVGTSDQYT